MADKFFDRGDNGSYEWTSDGLRLCHSFKSAVERFLNDRFDGEDYDILDAKVILMNALDDVLMHEGIRRRLTPLPDSNPIPGLTDWPQPDK